MKTLRSNKPAGYPRVINTDKAPSLAKAIFKLKAEGICPPTVEHRRVKYLQQRAGRRPRTVKRILGPKAAFKNLNFGVPHVEGDRGDALDSRKGQGTMFAYGHPNPDAVIVSRVFEAA